MDDSDNLDIASPGNGEADATTTGTSTAPQSLVPKQLSLPLPLSIHTALRLHLTQLETSNLIFLTTTDPSTSSSSTSALGSFVYAIPNRLNPSNILSTALYSTSGSIDLATRVAKILARRTGKPVYVGCSATFHGATVEEEAAAVKAAVETILRETGGLQTREAVNGK